LVDVRIPLIVTAANLLPSADEAIASQLLLDEPEANQETPALVER
jgi:hypothetical protein